MDYYLLGKQYRGLLVEQTLGYYSIHSTVAGSTEASSPVCSLSSLQWRGGISGELGFAIGAGLEVPLNPPNNSLNFRGILPVLIVEIAYAF